MFASIDIKFSYICNTNKRLYKALIKYGNHTEEDLNW
jgi:hypothetical protein